MILNISNNEFQDIMHHPRLRLPLRWDGNDFEQAVIDLLDTYENTLYALCEHEGGGGIKVDVGEAATVSNLLKQCVGTYYQGFPTKAYEKLCEVMDILMDIPLELYYRDCGKNPLDTPLFRLRRVEGVGTYGRKDIFHVPAYARAKAAVCRYSIVGCPALHLTTSIRLGMRDMACESNDVMAARFKMINPEKRFNIRILELGIKPQDFWEENAHCKRDLSDMPLDDDFVREAYLLWYPLIAVCSFIRNDPDSLFSPEYIVPHLLMQWARARTKDDNLVGIRYFSCASVLASDMGFNCVFPTSAINQTNGYCAVLRNVFLLTEPVLVKDGDAIEACEAQLIACDELDGIKP